jgi:hypothetical protein
MKKALLTVVVAAVSLTVFAQGKLSFSNDSLHLVYMNPDPAMLLLADAGLAGQSVPAFGQLPSGALLDANLYLGLSPSSLALAATAPFSSIPGEWMPSNLVLPYAGGTTLYCQVQVYDPLETYFGESVLFTVTAGSGVVYPPLSSFWPTGPHPVSGGQGAIMVSLVPEPSALALAGLGVVLLGWRRRI